MAVERLTDGPATLYLARADTDMPSDNAPWGEPWVSPGATEGPVELRSKVTRSTISVEEAPAPIARPVDKRKSEVSFSLSEDAIERLHNEASKVALQDRFALCFEDAARRACLSAVTSVGQQVRREADRSYLVTFRVLSDRAQVQPI